MTTAREEPDVADLRSDVTKEAEQVAESYGRPVDELRGYAAVMAVYAAAVGTAAVAMKQTGRLPRRFRASDLMLVALATHKLSRTVSKDAVTSPVRAPFARFEGPGGPGEVTEEVADDGARHAVGELLTCPSCLDQWIAT